MSALLQALESGLAELAGKSQRRVHHAVETVCAPRLRVDGRDMLAFCSNDYLGLASHPALVQALSDGVARWGVGSGASHLVSGHYAVHEALEQRLASFTGMPRALLLTTGYMANIAVMPALLGRGDAIFADRLNHASLVDGALLSRAELHRYPHSDLAALERMLSASDARRKLIVSDAVFSMDGDIAPLPELLALARRFDTWLLLDDAHGFGVLGPQGRGSVAAAGLSDPRIIYMGTLGKAAGVSGAFVAGHQHVVEWLLQTARPHIFTTAAPPALAHALLTSLDLIEQGDARRQHLQALIRQLHDALRLSRWRLLASDTPIQPIIIGDNAETLAVAAALADAGLWVPAIRPPTVPKGEARLRVTLSASHQPDDVARLAACLMRLETPA